MKKFINSPENAVRESLEGFAACFEGRCLLHPEVNGVLSAHPRRDKVVLVVGGGSGHEPMFSGFIGPGLADAAACGNFFASPDPATVYKTAKAVAGDRGVLFLYGNYAGDNLNFDMAEDMLRRDGIACGHVRVRDDCASAPKSRIMDRRGVAGDLFMIKLAGAACDEGMSLDELLALMERAQDALRSIGVAVSSAQIPGASEPIFTIGDDEMEYGMGIHGERGIERTRLAPADAVAERLYSELMAEMELRAGDEICVLVNGLGSTTAMELCVVFRRLKSLLLRDGIIVADSDINSYCTTLEMGGFSVSFLRLDETLRRLYFAPCSSPYYTRGRLPAETSGGETLRVSGGGFESGVYEPERGHAYIESLRGGMDPERLSFQTAKAMLLRVAESVVDAEPLLTRVDSAIGDGDHGLGMKAGLQRAHGKLLDSEDGGDAFAPFSLVGTTMLMTMGGASGVIFGSMFMAGAQDQPPKSSLAAADLAAMMARSLRSIQDRGQARVGDKTMVDALSPAVDAMSAEAGRGMLPMLRAAEAAAQKGMESTKGFEAKFGRAKTQGSTLGHQDAGATSVWLIFKAMADFVQEIGGQHEGGRSLP